MYECKRCGYSSDQKGHLLRHLTKKIPCKTSNNNICRQILIQELTKYLENDYAITCHICSKLFSTKSTFYKHEKQCQSERINNMEEELKNIKDTIKGTTINTTNIQNNIVINVKSFGHENIDHLPKDFLNSCLMMNNIVPLIENIHFDKEHPENHNVKIKSIKQELMETFVDGKWIITDTDDTLNELINKGYRVLNYHSRKNKNDIIDTEMNEDEYDDVLSWLEKIYEDKKTRKPIKKQLLLLFLNNKTMLLGKEE